MSIPGLPYSEPAFSAMETIDFLNSSAKAYHFPRENAKRRPPEVIGITYLITHFQLRQIVASEGGGTANVSCTLRGEPVAEYDVHFLGRKLWIVRLVAGTQRQPPGIPSRRYMVRIFRPVSD